MSIRQVAAAFIGVALIAILVIDVRGYLKVRDELKAKTTATRMLDLMQVLEVEQPSTLDPEHLRSLAVKYNRLGDLNDAWGRPLLIERSDTTYTIISLGRSGRRGTCCRKFVASWDENAVLSGSTWLQVWRMHGTK